MEPYFIFHIVYEDGSEDNIWTRDQAEAYYIANDAQQDVSIRQINVVEVTPEQIRPFPDVR